MARIKICGITRQEDLEASVEAGADALGFNVWEKSKRYAAPELLKDLLPAVPPYVQRVAVTVNLFLDQVRGLEEQLDQLSDGRAAFDLWQLHGHESPEVTAALAPRRVVKMLALKTNEPLPNPAEYPTVDGFLLDTPCVDYGGSGKTFDWDLAVAFKATTDKPIILSGGLTPDNVAEAIEKVQPYAVDVASGVEASPGIKDPKKIHDFLQAARGAA